MRTVKQCCVRISASAREEKVTLCSFLLRAVEESARNTESHNIDGKEAAPREKHSDLENGKVRVSRVKRSDTGDE